MSGTDKPPAVPPGSTAQLAVAPAPPSVPRPVRPQPEMQRFTKSLPKGDLQKG